jgi:hypothetical protein
MADSSHLDLYIVGYLHKHRVLFYVRNQTVNTGVGHDAIAGFQTRDQILLLLLPFFLRRIITMKINGTKNEPMPPPGIA